MPKEELYYYYHNPEKNPHLMIHKGECGDCKNGQGKHLTATKGLNSVWTGPFNSFELVKNYVSKNLKINYEINYCSKCKPNEG